MTSCGFNAPTHMTECARRRSMLALGEPCHDSESHSGRRRRTTLPLDAPSPADPSASRTWTDYRAVFQTTNVRMRIARNTLWALCTAIPIQALRYRFVGYAMANISRSVPGIAHGTCRW